MESQKEPDLEKLQSLLGGNNCDWLNREHELPHGQDRPIPPHPLTPAYRESMRVAAAHEALFQTEMHRRLEMGHIFSKPDYTHGVMQPAVVHNTSSGWIGISQRSEKKMKTRLQKLALQVAARTYNVDVADIEAVLENQDAKLIGFTGFNWAALIIQIMQIVMELMGDCQFGQRMTDSVRRPNFFARSILRMRANRVFRNGDAAFANMGNSVAAALEEEAADTSEDDISGIVSEIKNPNPYMLI